MIQYHELKLLGSMRSLHPFVTFFLSNCYLMRQMRILVQLFQCRLKQKDGVQVSAGNEYSGLNHAY